MDSGDPLVRWIIELNAADATATLAKFANLTKEQINDLNDEAKKKNFLDAMAAGVGKSPAIQETLLQFASLEKSALGVAAALRLAGRHTDGFADLNEQLKSIDELFKAGTVSAGMAQSAIGKVADEGAERTAHAEREKVKAAREAANETMRLAREEADYEASLRQADVALAKQVEAAILRDHKENVASMIDSERAAAAAKKADADKAAADENTRLSRRREAMRTLGFTALGGVGMATMAVRGAASAGFADTMQGQQSQVYGQLLNRQVATIFAPLLEERTKYVSQMTQWLQGLSEPQKESIRSLSMFTVSMTTLGFLVPKVTKALATLAVSAQAAARAQAIAAGTNAAGSAIGSASGMAAMAGPVGVGIAVIGAVLSSSEKGREAIANLAKAMEPVAEGLAHVVNVFSVKLGDTITDLSNSVSDLRAGRYTSAARNAATGGAGYLGMVIPGGGLVNDFTRWLTGTQASSARSSSGLSPVPKGIEDIGRDYERIMEAATKINLEQNIANNTANIAQSNATIAAIVQEWRPFFAGNPTPMGAIGP